MELLLASSRWKLILHMQKKKKTVKLNNVFAGRDFFKFFFFFFFWLNEVRTTFLSFYIFHDFPWSINAHAPNWMTLRRESVFLHVKPGGFWSVLIYTTWGMNVLHFLWVAVVSQRLHCILIHAFLLILRVSSHVRLQCLTRIASMHSKCYFHT